MLLVENLIVYLTNDETSFTNIDQLSSKGLMLEETSETSIPHASTYTITSSDNKHWFHSKIGAIVLNYFLISKTMLFRNNAVLENGSEVACEHHLVKAYNAIMDHIRQHANLTIELLTEMLVFLRSDDAEVIDCGGLNIQPFDTFANNMCHNFYRIIMNYLVNPMVTSDLWT